MPAEFHIVGAFLSIGGGEAHATELQHLLTRYGCNVTLWADRPTPFMARYGAQLIQPFSGKLPRGGTLVVIGTYVQLGAWLKHARPDRVIVICNYSSPALLFAMLERLAQAGMPDAEIVYVSARLGTASGLPGYVCPPLVDIDHFRPAAPSSETHQIKIGRLSRDEPYKHHTDDASLYRLLAWQGWQIRIMGGCCLTASIGSLDAIELLAPGAEDAAAFLNSLDIFFYRTAPDWPEPSGRVIIEAMASGLPVVAHTNGGYTDWIRHEENGFLFNTQEEALQALNRLRDEPSLRHRLGCQARLDAELHAGNSRLAAYASWLIGATLSG